MANEGGMVQARATRREWIGLAVLALPTLLAAMDFSVLFLALPHLGADLRAGSTQLLWIIDIYGFMIAGFLVTIGTLGDRIGRRRLLLIGASAFAVVSVLAAYSTSAEMLIATRALLGIAGATLMPSTLALISNMFRDPKQRATAISLWASCLLVGTVIGPVVGGVLLEWFWWGSVFLMGVPVMVLLLITAPLLLPEYHDPRAGRLDLTSAALSLAAILPIVYGLKESAKDGLGTRPVLAVVIGVAMGVVFVRRQRRLTSPLLDLRLFANRSFSAALGILLVGAAASGGVAFLFAQYLQMVQELSPLRAGLWMIPDTAAMIAGSLMSPIIARRVRPGYVIGAGLTISMIGFLVLTQVQATSGLPLAVTSLVIIFLGIAPTWVLGTDLIVGSAAPEKAGSASSLSETGSELGVALGVAVLGSLGTAVYRNQVTIPADAPPQAAEATHDTLAGATAAAGQLPDPLGAALLEPARQAFTHGFNTAGLISAATATVLAILATTLLRHTPPSARTPQSEKAADEIGTAPATAEEPHHTTEQ